MTNLEKWRNYNRDLTSPDSFIDMSFYYMINACLQRRVWTGPVHKPLFPHDYMILVGPAAVGKGLILGTVADFIKFWKVSDLKKPDDVLQSQAEDVKLEARMVRDEIIESIADNPEYSQIKQQLSKEPSLLFPVAADATTYQALLRAMTKVVRRIDVPKGHPMAPSGIYTYKSMTFILEEVSSLFEEHAKLLCQFLLNAFDAGEYKYETKNMGTDHLKRMSMGILGGTVPEFIQETFKSKLLTNGFASRTIFVFEFAPRFYRFGISELDNEQKQQRLEILLHLKHLARLFGNVEIEPEAMEFMKHYFEVLLPKPDGRVNKSLKLDSYYGRKNVHLTKMAMAVHFADSLEMKLTLKDCQEALRLLDSCERKMHLALNYGGDNALAGVGKSIIKYLRQNGASTFREIWIEFVDMANEQGIRESLRYAMTTGLVRMIKMDTGNGVEEGYEFTKQ